MNIAYIYDAIYPYVNGGVEKRIHELAIRLVGRGHQVHLYGMQFWEAEPTLQKDGIWYHGVSLARPFYTKGRRSIIQPFYFAYNLGKELRGSDHDLIDCQNFPYIPSFAARWATRKTPLIITWHEVWGDYWYEYLGSFGIIGKFLEKRAIGLADRMIAVSPMTKRALHELGAPGGINCIPNGIDTRAIEAIEPSGERSNIIFAGRLIKEKHPDLILRAMSILREERPDLRAVFIGDGPERERLLEERKRLGLEENVSFTGFLPTWEAVIGMMKASSVFVLPSTREGFGIAALEAMACGLPVVTINHPQNAVNDLIKGGCGTSCPLDPGDLAEAIESALMNTDILGQAGRERAIAYDWDLIVDRIEEAYQKTIEEVKRA